MGSGSLPLKKEAGLLPAAHSEARGELVHWTGIAQNPVGRVLVQLEVAL